MGHEHRGQHVRDMLAIALMLAIAIMVSWWNDTHQF